MSLESVIQQAIEKAAEAIIPVTITQGIVTSVDKDKNTCDVERESLPDLFDVRLNAIVSPGKNVVSVYPNTGAHVLVALVEKNKTDGYVLTCNDIEEITINGGENGGIAISQKLIDEIQEIKEDLNSLKTVIQGWTPVTQDGGAALKTALSTWFAQQLPDVDSNVIINDKVKH